MSDSQTPAEAQTLGGEALPVPPGAVSQPIPHPEPDTKSGVSGDDPSPPALSAHHDVQDRAQFADQVHQYVREYITLADQKAGFFFAGYTALLAFLYRNGAPDRWLKPLMSWNIIDILAFIAMAGLAVSALLCVYVVIPRLAGSRRGYLFFEAVAEYPTARDYADEIASKTAASLVLIKAEHCYELAKVCRAKYSVLRIALWTGSVGLAAALAVLLFS